jgi:hypothetical protein
MRFVLLVTEQETIEECNVRSVLYEAAVVISNPTSNDLAKKSGRESH